MDTKKIGAFLKQCRKEKNLTQEQLAEKFEVSARTVSRWETGINMPDLSILVQLAEYYDVEIRELLDGERSQTMNKEMKETLDKVAVGISTVLIIDERECFCFFFPHRFSHMDFIALNPGSLEPGKNAFCFSKSALRAGSRLLTGKYGIHRQESHSFDRSAGLDVYKRQPLTPCCPGQTPYCEDH